MWHSANTTQIHIDVTSFKHQYASTSQVIVWEDRLLNDLRDEWNVKHYYTGWRFGLVVTRDAPDSNLYYPAGTG